MPARGQRPPAGRAKDGLKPKAAGPQSPDGDRLPRRSEPRDDARPPRGGKHPRPTHADLGRRAREQTRFGRGRTGQRCGEHGRAGHEQRDRALEGPHIGSYTAAGREVPARLVRVPTLRYLVADVFTDKPLTGNQLAVFTDAREISEEMLQPLAKEMAFSETVFVYPPSKQQREPSAETANLLLPPEAGGHARIRIFTPATELPFAGHPVLGSAFVLGAPLQLGEIRLETGSGVVPVTLEREGARIIFGRMQQPIPNWE